MACGRFDGCLEMSSARRLKPDETAETLGLIATKLEAIDARQQADTTVIRADVKRLEETMNANPLELNAKLNLILAKL